jgi:azurin
MPVVVAAVEGLGDPRWGYHGPATSTGGAGVLMIVNGPIARALDFNSGDNLFGPGWRANATVGRAVRLVMRNVIGTRPGELDRGTLGHPGKYTYVIAENETESPWTPLHVERGFRADQSAVTVMAAEAPHQFYNQLSSTAAGVLTTLSDDMRVSGNVMGQPNYVLVIAGEHMRTIAADGWSKADIRKYVFEHTQNTVAHLKRTGRLAGAVTPADETTLRPLVASPEDILVVAAGGRAGAFSAYIPGWASRKSSEAVTKLIKDRRA